MTNKQNGFAPFFDSDNTIVIDEVDTSTMDSAELLPESCIIMRVKMNSETFRKRLNTNEVLDHNKRIQSKDVSASKQIIGKKYLAEIKSLDGATRTMIRDNLSLHKPAFVADGCYLLPIGLYNHTVQLLEKFKKKRNKLVQKLKEEYSVAMLEFKTTNADIYDPADYPSVRELDELFSVHWSSTGISMPTALEHLNEAVMKEESDKLRKELSDTMEDIKMSLRGGFVELIDGMVDKLKGMGTERKRFTQGFVRNFKTFLDTFDARNLANDDELAALVRDARNVLDGVSPHAIKTDLEVKVRVEQGFDEIKTRLSSFVVNKTRPVKL